MVTKADYDKLKAQFDILNESLNSKLQQQNSHMPVIKSELIDEDSETNIVEQVYSESQEEELINQANELLNRSNFLKFKDQLIDIHVKLEALWSLGAKTVVVVNGKACCVKCRTNPAEKLNRCRGCYERLRSLRKRLNVNEYQKCHGCSRFTWMRSLDNCITCYNKAHGSNTIKTVKIIKKNDSTPIKSVLNDNRKKSRKRRLEESTEEVSAQNSIKSELRKKEEQLTTEAQNLLLMPIRNEPEMKRLLDELTKVWTETGTTVIRRGEKIECVKCGTIGRNCGLFRCGSCYYRIYALRQKLKMENYEKCIDCLESNMTLIDKRCTKCNEKFESEKKSQNVNQSMIVQPSTFAESDSESNCQSCNSAMNSNSLCPINPKICRLCFVKERNRRIEIVCIDCHEIHRHFSAGKCFECFEIKRDMDTIFGSE